MSLFHNPRTVTDGLVANFDAANLSSYRGTTQTNLLTTISNQFSTVDNSTFKVSYGSSVVDIPTIGRKTARWCDIYNDYNGGSGNCCPSLFAFGDFTSGVTGSTTYTYSIIYKTATGYTHPNYMYRYENNGSTYLTEAGVHSDSNRTHLGNGWYHAWGQFTTQPTTNRLLTYLFHYEYATYNRVWVADVSLTQGTYIPSPQHMLTVGTSRSNTVSSGGGWIGMASTQQNATTTANPSFENTNKGVLTFNGSTQWAKTDNSFTFGNNYTWEAWVNRTSSVNTYNMFMGRNLPYFGILSSNDVIFSNLIGGAQQTVYSTGVTMQNNTWYHLAFTTEYTGSNTISRIYINGSLNNSATFSGAQGEYSGYSFQIGDGGNPSGAWYPFNGKVGLVRLYSKTLSASEILQNYNATKGRYN